jgi:glycosyltransferase involved in cell wall biosynthesis
MLAPPWLPVPPPGYGGIELVVAQLCKALTRRGHEVTLFAAPGSTSPSAVRWVLPDAHPEEIGQARIEADHVGRVYDSIEHAADVGQGFDVIHDHCGFVALAMAERIAAPVVHTVHGPFTADVAGFYQRHADKAEVVAISEAQRRTAPTGLRISAVVPNPMDAADWPFQPQKADHVLWIGRMDRTKGPHRAITAARAAGVPIVLAGPVQPGQQEYFDSQVGPWLDDERVRYVGELGGRDKQRAFAEARALLMPIRWNEPFGMVMVEALACGTPVIAFPEGATPEIVRHGSTGFLVDDERQMAAAIAELDQIDPAACRADVVERFSPAVTAAGYEAVYRRAAAAAGMAAVAAAADVGGDG